MLKRLFGLFLPALLVACTLAPPANIRFPSVSGKVSAHANAQPDIEISAWPATTASLSDNAPYRSAASGSDGTFSLNLPEGEYYFLARGKGLFAYYGRNPLTIPPEGLSDLRISLVPIPPPPAPPGEATIESGIAGRLLIDGAPLAGGVVYAYTDLASQLKGMGYALSAPSDEQGIFELPLPAGTYYLLARMRKEGGMVMGPLRAGDFIGYAPLNPVKVAVGRIALVSIPMLEVPEKVERLSATLFGQTSLRGRILNRNGEPVAGMRATLYSEPQMLNRPLFVSQPSGADGSFILSFPNGGIYYLAARQQLGGAPAPGELFGTYDATLDHALEIGTGEQKAGIELIVEEMW